MIERALPLLTLAALLLSGCVSGPSPAASDETGSEGPPSWVTRRPEDDASYKYFVGAGTSRTGDLAEARSIAAGDIFSAVQRFIGVDFSSVTIAENLASLDSFKTDITQTIVQEGAARVAGFEIIESWTNRSREPAVTLHLLARYDRRELLKEKERQEALLKEEQEAIAGPERDGRAAMAAGRYYEAAQRFIVAASNALNSDLPNADIRFKRNIDQAAEAVGAINLVKISGDQTVLVGRVPGEPLRLKAAAGPSESADGIPDVLLRVSYRELHRPSGRIRAREGEIVTDEAGFGSFSHPVPEFVGTSDVTVSLFLDVTIEGLDGAPESQRELVDRLEQSIARKRIRYTLVFGSEAKEVRTGLLSVDYGADGELAGLTQSAAGLRRSLSDFSLSTLPVSPGDLAGKSEPEVLELLRERFGGTVPRVILAVVRIMSTRESGGKTLAKASGTVQVVDTGTGEVLYATQREKSGLGQDARSAAASAFRSLGEALGQEIRNNLR